MGDELISVIIPAYNVEKYLAACLESIVCQTYNNLEIVVIDDGSTDNTAVICDEYAKKDSRIRIIHQENKGIASTRNVGIHEAKGEYLFWIDSDDFVDKNIIMKLYKLIRKYSADISICDYIQGSNRDYQFVSSGRIEESILEAKTGFEKIYESNHSSFIMAASWGKLIRKSAYDGLKYPDGLIFEDIYMSHHLIANCEKIVYTNEIMYYYYQWPESILGKKLHINKLDYLGAFEERIHFFDKLGYMDLKELATKQYLHSLMWEYSRAKDILHDKSMVSKVVRQYRKYYKFGMENDKFKHETKWYMFKFYVSPLFTDLLEKIKNKVGLRK